MTIREMNVSATILRRVLAKRPVINFDEVEDVVMVKLDPPSSSGGSSDKSPRNQPAYSVRYRAGVLGLPYPVLAGSRISMSRNIGDGSVNVWESLLYEVLTDARPTRVGGKTTGWQITVMPYNELYPLESSITAPDVDDPFVSRVALWSSSEVEGDHGDYEDYDGEAPIDASDILLKQNAKITVSDNLYRVMTAVVDFEGPRVRFTARRTRG